MFFSSELLSKRDSGFGLLWLAATLGSKSAFKKLPKRSVMTADISQLCRLIAMPAEPLALRLSSNLLVGAARVYKVKQDILMSDVTMCFNSLKRVEQELRSMSEGQLQMAQSSVKSSTVTLRVDPGAAFSMDFDAMITNWDEYLNIGGNGTVGDESDDNYQPKTVKTKRKTTTSSIPAPDSELVRATACTLPDSHDFLLTNSFDASFGGSGSLKFSSSQQGGFGFDDTFDGLDIGEGVGEDLVRELGEGWGASWAEVNEAEHLAQPQEPFIDGGFDGGMTGHALFPDEEPQEWIAPETIRNSPLDLAASFSPHLGTPRSIDLQIVTDPGLSPAIGVTTQPGCAESVRPKAHTLPKTKRARAMLDVRTELTDEELKATRLYYVNKQNIIRCELESKKFEKRQVDLINTMLWKAPGTIYAKELADFWVGHFKAHVEARSFLIGEPQYTDDNPRQKRRKISAPPLQNAADIDIPMMPVENQFVYQGATDDGDMVDFNINADWGDAADYTNNPMNPRSSEEPGQPRRASHPSGIGDNIGIEMISDTFHSQRSALFPWDMAGSSSSVSARGGIHQSDRMSVEQADAKLGGSSASRRGSSVLSIPGNPLAGLESPTMILPTIPSDDDFVFEVPGIHPTAESQQQETNRIALEKNSYNFLGYAKMQYRSLPNSHYLAFDDVVPKTTSTARVAAAALYHCLVLATKDLLRVNQAEPYGRINIQIVY